MILDRTHIALIAGAVLIAGIGLHEYEQGAKADAVSKATQDANQKIIQHVNEDLATRQKQINDLQDKLKQSESDKAAMQAQIDKKYQQVKTPAQARAVTAQNLGVSPDEVKTGGTAEKPTLEVPQKPALDYQKACETCQLNLKISTQQLSYSEQIRQEQAGQLSAKDQKIGALTDDLDKANNAAKGGSWLKRAVRAGKYIIIGAGAGAAVLCGSGHCK